jgi:DNA repair exonuclease SbcCD ATPase subunit
MHDLLLSVRPDGAVHDATACIWCSPVQATDDSDRTEGGVLDVSITQEDLDKAVAAAVAPLQTELEALRKFKADVESTDAAKAAEQAIEEAKAEAAELQGKLDAATIAATEANTKYEDLLAWLAAEAEKAEQEAQIAALRDERVEAVKALKLFPEEYVEENAQRYAEMPAEIFEASVADWKAVKAAKATEESEDSELPKQTTFVATRDDDGKPKASHMREVMRLRHEGIDPRRIRG